MKLLKIIALGLGVIIGIFVFASLGDIVIAVMNARFYSDAAFITIFGVAGIFAGVISYTMITDQGKEKDKFTHWSTIILMVGCGLIFFFPLATIEGGEYKAAFKAYGATLALVSLFFIKG